MAQTHYTTALDDFFAFLNEKYEAEEDMVTYDPFNPEDQLILGAQETMNDIIYLFDITREECRNFELDLNEADVFQRFANALNKQFFSYQLKLRDIPEDSVIRNVLIGELSSFEVIFKELRTMGIIPDAGSIHTR